MDFIELVKALLYGIVEGITEWLPISSTGHLILLEQWCPLNVPNAPAFYEMFDVVIQLGAILAVMVLFFRKLNPLSATKSQSEKQDTWHLWWLVILAVLPSALLGFLLDDWLEATLYNHITVAITLILYGILFMVIEKYKPSQNATLTHTSSITVTTALLIGAFQVLALIPGTSRSGATILGAMLLGLSRSTAAEFSFFLAIPTMAGASLLKIVKFATSSNLLSLTEWGVLVVGCLSAFVVSLCVIKFLMDFVKKHSFTAFGVYRIILGVLVLGYFLLFR